MSARNRSLPRIAASARAIADQALGRFIGCAAPFLEQMRVPPHSGEEPLLFRHGTSTAKWEPD